MTLNTVADLRAIYRPAAGPPIDKVIHALDDHCRDFLAKSPFFVLSTADGEGRCDGSPKGGLPGFVEMLDERRVAWADYSGNNRLDSFENLVDNDHVALLFLIPGLMIAGQYGYVAWLERGERVPVRALEGHGTLASEAERHRSRVSPRAFLRMSWLANPCAYVAIATAIPLIPTLAERLA